MVTADALRVITWVRHRWVLLREFRSPVSTPDGLVHELPGGSAAPESDALDQAITETEEEAGLTMEVQRIRSHGSRQLTATMSAHRAQLFPPRSPTTNWDGCARARRRLTGPQTPNEPGRRSIPPAHSVNAAWWTGACSE
jgi:hypothetical protein